MSAGPVERCLSRAEIVRFLEGERPPGVHASEGDIAAHLEACEPCRKSRDNVLHELSGLEQSLSLLWTRERISCPHRDILAAYLHASLPGDQSDYVRFHLEIVGCDACAANLSDLREADREEPPAIQRVRDDVLRSTTAFLGKRKK
ncbi:MAG: hypothetical protein HYR85_02405 [Planctomycetes bacterium]|nr:hypothetical protein [Planctomycetota bacterium]MBI3846873.1 hypothetical protein [Planctomycetota bacterium]